MRILTPGDIWPFGQLAAAISAKVTPIVNWIFSNLHFLYVRMSVYKHEYIVEIHLPEAPRGAPIIGEFLGGGRKDRGKVTNRL